MAINVKYSVDFFSIVDFPSRKRQEWIEVRNGKNTRSHQTLLTSILRGKINQDRLFLQGMKEKEGVVEVWDLVSRNIIHTLSVPTDTILLSGSMDYLALTHKDRLVLVKYPEMTRRVFPEFNQVITNVHFDEDYLVVLGKSNFSPQVSLINLTTRKVVNVSGSFAKVFSRGDETWAWIYSSSLQCICLSRNDRSSYRIVPWSQPAAILSHPSCFISILTNNQLQYYDSKTFAFLGNQRGKADFKGVWVEGDKVMVRSRKSAIRSYHMFETAPMKLKLFLITGLAQETGVWTSFLLRGLYDPRLFLLIGAMILPLDLGKMIQTMIFPEHFDW